MIRILKIDVERLWIKGMNTAEMSVELMQRECDIERILHAVLDERRKRHDRPDA